MRMVSAPSPKGTNFAQLFVPESWGAHLPRMAADAAPKRKIARDDEARVYPDNATLGERVLAMLDSSKFSVDEMRSIRESLDAGTAQDDNESITAGPLGPHSHEPPVARDEDAEKREFLRSKGLDDGQIESVLGPRANKDEMPRNAREGGMGGRTAIGMDDALHQLTKRLEPGRGEGFMLPTAREEAASPSASMDAAAQCTFDAMYPNARRFGV